MFQLVSSRFFGTVSVVDATDHDWRQGVAVSLIQDEPPRRLLFGKLGLLVQDAHKHQESLYARGNKANILCGLCV